MRRDTRGFTLIELVIAVVIIGILLAVTLPNMMLLQARAKEGGTKSNQHTFQIVAEDYVVQNDGQYASNADDVAALLPGGGTAFRNPFTQSVGEDVAWENRSDLALDPSATPGLVSYAASPGGDQYNIKAYGRSGTLTLVLTSSR